MTLASPGAIPPMTLSSASKPMETPAPPFPAVAGPRRRSEEVPLDDIARAQDGHRVAEVAGDHVALAGNGASDQDGVGAGDPDAVARVGDCAHAGSVGADDVSLEDLPSAPACTSMPSPRWPETRFPAITVPGARVRTPRWLAIAAAPSASVPMKLPWTRFPAPGPSTSIPRIGRRSRCARTRSARRCGCRGGHHDPGDAIAVGGRSCRVHSDPAPLDDPVAGRKPDAVEAEAPDGEAAHDDPGCRQIQPDGSGAGARAVQRDQGQSGKSRLRAIRRS